MNHKSLVDKSFTIFSLNKCCKEWKRRRQGKRFINAPSLVSPDLSFNEISILVFCCAFRGDWILWCQESPVFSCLFSNLGGVAESQRTQNSHEPLDFSLFLSFLKTSRLTDQRLVNCQTVLPISSLSLFYTSLNSSSLLLISIAWKDFTSHRIIFLSLSFLFLILSLVFIFGSEIY